MLQRKCKICVVLLLAGVMSLSLSTAKDNETQFVLPVPEDWQTATRIRLVLDGVTVPGNVPLKVRVTSKGQDGQEVFIGSAGIEALGRDKSQARPLPILQLDVTRSLRRLLENRVGEKKTIELRIQPVDGRSNPIPGLKWSCERARLETTRLQSNSS
jgi:hypothetical protein